MTTTATTQQTIIHQLRDPETGKPLHPSRYAKDMQVIAVGTGPAPAPFGRIEVARWRHNTPEPSDAEWQRLGDLLECGDKDGWRNEIVRFGGEIVSMVVGRWQALEPAIDDEGQLEAAGGAEGMQ